MSIAINLAGRRPVANSYAGIHFHPIKKRATWFVHASVLLFPLVVFAQESTPAVSTTQPTDEASAQKSTLPVPASSEAVEKPTNRFIQEIVVTAQKREENLQDVPISVSAFSGENLEARGVDDPKALEKITPGLNYSGFVGFSIIYLRGVGTDVFLPSADTSVATYIDGVYLPFSHALAQNFVKLDRIEVLKGPQGTLFGRNSTGGAINIITKKPSDHFELSADAGEGNFSSTATRVFVTGPLLKTLSGSMSLLFDKSDPYSTLTANSSYKKLDTDITRGINAKLHWQPLDALSADANVLETNFNGTFTVPSVNEQTKPLGVLLGIKPVPRYQYGESYRNELYAHNVLVYGQTAWEPDWFTTKLQGSYQKVKTDTFYDFDGSAENIVTFHTANQFLRDVTSEFQLLSKKGGLFPDWLTLTSGAYFYHSTGGFNPAFFGAVDLSNLGALPLPPALQGLAGSLQPVFNSLTQAANNLPVPLPTSGATLALRGVVATKAYAGYLQTTVTPWDWIDITVGGRYQIEKRGVTDSSTSLVLSNNAEQRVLTFGHPSTTNYNLAPKVTLDIKPIEGQLFYASAQKAEKSGTYNSLSIYTPPGYVKPEKVTAFEVGNKGTLFDGSLRYGLAIFQSRIDDLQTLIVSLQSGGAVSLANAAVATIRGAEFDTTWQVLPHLLPGLVVTASGAYLHGVYNSFPNGPGFDSTTGLFFGPGSLVDPNGRNFSGNKTVRTPKFSTAVAPGYTFNAPGGSAELAGDLYYTSGFFYDTQNTASQPSYILLGLHGSYLYDPWNLRLTAYVKNLNNAFYYINKFATDFGINAGYGAPRQFGAKLSYEF